MALSVQDLMKPRYKVIAGYFFSPYSIGDLLKQSNSGTFYVTKTEAFVDGVRVDIDDYVSAGVIDKYPHLFKPLQWWEERSESDMPGYVKQTGMIDSFNNPVPDWYLKVKKHFRAGNGEWRDDSYNIFWAEKDWRTTGIAMNYSGFEPATETGYNDYIQSLKQKQ